MVALQFNLSFVPSQTDAVFLDIAIANNAVWQIEEAQLVEWAECMSSRLRTLLRHVQQARIKQKPPKWLEQLGLEPWERKTRGKVVKDGDGDNTAPAAGMKAGKMVQKFTVFDDAKNVARQTVFEGGFQKCEEEGDEFVYEDSDDVEAQKKGQVRAKFADGLHLLPITVFELKKTSRRRCC